MNNSTNSDNVRRNSRRQTRRTGTATSFAGAVIRGTGMALVSGLLLLLVAAVAAYSAPDPDALSRPLALAALYVGCFAGGIMSMRVLGSGTGYGASALAAAVINAVMLIITAFRPDESKSESLWLSLLLHLAVFAAFLVGAYAGRRRPARRRRPGRR